MLKQNFEAGDRIRCIKNTTNNVANIKQGMTGTIIKITDKFKHSFDLTDEGRLCIKIDDVENWRYRYYLLHVDDFYCYIKIGRGTQYQRLKNKNENL